MGQNNNQKNVKKNSDDNLSILPEDASVLTRLSVLFGILLIALIVVIVVIKIFFWVKNDMNTKAISYVSQAEYYGELVETVSLVEDYSKLDDGFLASLKDNCQYIVKKYKSVSPTSEQICGILLMDRYYDFGKQEELIKYLNKYYDSDTKMFTSVKNEEVAEEEKVSCTLHIAHILRRYDDVLEKYEVYDGLSIWFNEKVKSGAIEENADILSDIFYYMYDENKQSMLNYEELEDYLVKEVVSYKSKIDIDNLEYNLSEVIMAKKLSVYRQVFLNKSDYVDSATEIFEEIDKKSGFMADGYGILLPYAINNTLTYVNDIEENSFFTENVGDVLYKYYETFLKYKD